MADPLISVVALQDHLARGGLRLVDATWFLPDAGRDARAEYLEGHLPGAVFFDIDAISDTSSPLPHMLPSPRTFAHAMGRLGLAGGDPVVVYDRRPTAPASPARAGARLRGHPRRA